MLKCRNMLRYPFCLFAILWLSHGDLLFNSGYQLSVIHLNDFHARFEETNQKSSSCKGVDCIGGISRVYSIVTQLIQERPNPIFLNAGDNYQGTLWYTLFKYNVTEHFLSKLPTDAYTLGNHEFDDQIKGLVPFMKAIKAPFVVSNIDDTNAPELKGLYKKSIVIERGGKRIGIVGCITVTTDEISSSEGLKFLDESESVNKESERLVAEEKVDTIIVLSHAGYEVDIHIAENASPKIGLIVGGHSHTFLFTGKPLPGPDRPAGPYPTVVKHADGRKILITQASSYTKYVGNITVTYNRNGDVSGWSGAPIYLDKNIPQDEAVEEDVLKWKKAVDQQGAVVVGETKLLLSNSGCRVKECTLGNLVTDSMVFSYPQRGSLRQWPHAPIALTIPGGIRTSIPAGNISFNDLVTCLPFGNTVDLAEVQGKHIREALEFSASAYHQHNGTNLLQVSGLRVVYNLTQPAGSRIMSLNVRCNECSETEYVDFDDEVYYRVAVNSFLADSGDGHGALGNNLRNRTSGEVDVDVLSRYITNYTPLSVVKDGRIQVVT